jgi:cellulose biosynthesis protein BcsQ
MIRAMLPTCAKHEPALLRLPRAIPKLFAAIKAEAEAEAAGGLVIFDPLQGPSTTTHLMLMACDTVIVPFDGTRSSLSALRLFLGLAPCWLEHYKPILGSHRPRIVVYATQKDQNDQKDQRMFPSAVVVYGTIADLLAHLTS